jgi:hypothetical protein
LSGGPKVERAEYNRKPPQRQKQASKDSTRKIAVMSFAEGEEIVNKNSLPACFQVINIPGMKETTEYQRR